VVAGQLFSQWVQTSGESEQRQCVNKPCSNLPVCYRLRLPHSQIHHGNEMLDMQIYNSRLKDNFPQCMLNHSTREKRNSFVPKSQQLRLTLCTTDLLPDHSLLHEKGTGK